MHKVAETKGKLANGQRVTYPFTASMRLPPSAPVAWTVADRTGKPIGIVTAQSWYAARAEAMATYRREAHELVVQRPDEKGPG